MEKKEMPQKYPQWSGGRAKREGTGLPIPSRKVLIYAVLINQSSASAGPRKPCRGGPRHDTFHQIRNIMIKFQQHMLYIVFLFTLLKFSPPFSHKKPRCGKSEFFSRCLVWSPIPQYHVCRMKYVSLPHHISLESQEVPVW